MSLTIDVRSAYDLGLRSWEALSTELSGRHQLNSLLASGTVRKVRRGWYMKADRWISLNPDERHLAVLLSLYFSVRTKAIVRGTSAATLHGAFQIKRDPSLHLSYPRFENAPSTGRMIKYQVRTLPELPVEAIHGVAVTGVTETLADCAMHLPVREGLVVADYLARRGADLGLLQSFVEANPGRRGIARLRQVLECIDPCAESGGESVTRLRIIEWGLPAPVSQYRVVTPRGPYRLDFAWPELKVALEFDGGIKYTGEQPTGEVLREERLRELALQNDGWIVIRTTWDEVMRDSAALRDRLERALNSRR